MKTLKAVAARYNATSLILRIVIGLAVGAVLALAVPGAGWVELFPLGISYFLAVRVYILFKIHVFIAMRYLSAAFRLKRIISVWNSCKSLAKPLVKL